MQTSLFIINTPRHWYVSLLICSQYKILNPIFLFENNFIGVEDFVKVTKDANIQTEILPGKNETQNKSGLIRRWLKSTDWIRTKILIKKVIKDNKVKEVFSANIGANICQYILHLLRRQNVNCYYMDDGLASYYNSDKNYSLIRSIQNKLTYGFWFKVRESFCTASWVAEAYVLEPNRVNKYLGNLNRLNKVNSHSLEGRYKTVVSQLTKNLGFNVLKLKSAKLILLLELNTHIQEYSANKNEDFIKKIQHYCTSLVEKYGEESIFIKYHPRESAPYLKVAENQVIPSQIPFEIIIESLPKGSTVITGVTTALFDTVIMRPDLNTIAIEYKKLPLEIKKTYESIGVSFTGFERVFYG